MFVSVGGGGEIHHGKGGENEGLDEADEKFKTEKWKGNKIRHKKSNNRKKNFSSKDVAEKSEWKGDDSWGLADDFKKSYAEIDRASKADEFWNMIFNSDGNKTNDVGKGYYYES